MTFGNKRRIIYAGTVHLLETEMKLFSLSLIASICSLALFFELQTEWSTPPVVVLLVALTAIIGGWAALIWCFVRYGVISGLGIGMSMLVFTFVDAMSADTVVDHLATGSWDHDLPIVFSAIFCLGAGIAALITSFVETLISPRSRTT